jgi:hypothetical protein
MLWVPESWYSFIRPICHCRGPIGERSRIAGKLNIHYKRIAGKKDLLTHHTDVFINMEHVSRQAPTAIQRIGPSQHVHRRVHIPT